MNLKEEIKNRIKIFEQSGRVALAPYLCPKKKWTIGWGYNYQDRGFTKPFLCEILVNVFGEAEVEKKLELSYTTNILTGLLTKGFTADMAERLLDADVEMVLSQCEDNFAWFAELDDVRKATVADMCYQMGITRLLTFKNTLKAVGNGYYTVAADGMEKSLWYKQSGDRAKINVEQMRTGKWVTHDV